MSREIVFYGEKGILNAIVLDTQGDIARQKQFIRTIILADKSKLNWVDDVCTVKYFVGPSLDQFGNPDMIIEAVTTNNDKYVLFVDAKLTSYQDSALNMEEIKDKNNEHLPRTYKNNCDKINIKLSLLYRFVKAYKNNLLDVKDINSIIIEEPEISSLYNDDIERKLENWTMIDYWNKNFEDAKDYYFIALTNDSKEIIDEKHLNSILFPYNNSSIMPPIGKEQWDLDKGKFGITTYDTLVHKNVVSKNNGYYKDSSDLMLITPPSIADYKRAKESQVLLNMDVDLWRENQKELYNLLKNIKDIDSEIKPFINSFMEARECN